MSTKAALHVYTRRTPNISVGGGLCAPGLACSKEFQQEIIINSSKACKSLFPRKGNILRYSPSGQLSWPKPNQVPCLFGHLKFYTPELGCAKNKTKQNPPQVSKLCHSGVKVSVRSHPGRGLKSPLPHSWAC